jgi:hypothetical protein
MKAQQGAWFYPQGLSVVRRAHVYQTRDRPIDRRLEWRQEVSLS